MINAFLRTILLTLPLVLGPFYGMGQGSAEQLLALQQQAISNYFITHHPDLTDWLDGRMHRAHYPFVSGHPFWKTDDWQMGRVQTDRVVYEEAWLRYDAFADALVYAPDPAAPQMVRLNPTQVVAFGMGEQAFVNLRDSLRWPGLTESKLKPGYYELLHAGKYWLLGQREKFIQQEQGNAILPESFAERSRYFLYHDAQFFPLEKKKDLKKLFPAHKAAIKTYLQQDALRLRRLVRFSKKELVELIQFCESL